MNILNSISLKLNLSKELFIKFNLSFVFIFLTYINSLSNVNNKIQHICIICILSTSSLTLYFEYKDFSLIKKIIFYIISILIPIFSIYFYEGTFKYLFLSFLCFFIYSRFAFKNSSDISFLNETIEIFKIFVFSAIVTAILCLGFYIIILSLKYLFMFNIGSSQEWLYYFITFIIFPSLVLLSIKKIENFKLQTMQYSKYFSFLLRQILLPLIFLYFIILYAYFIKIIIFSQLPKGYLSSIIIFFLSLCLLVNFFLVGLENKKKLTNIFNKYCYFIFIIPLIFLYIAIFTRILQYGLTEDRYLIIFISIWLSFIAILYIFKKNLNIKYIPLSLALMFLFISLTPFNPVQISANSQIKRFKNLLIEHKILQNNKITPLTKQLSKPIRHNIQSISDYIISNKIAKKQAEKLLHVKLQTSDNILYLLNIERTKFYTSNRHQLSFQNLNNIGFYTGSYDYAFNIQNLYNGDSLEFFYSSNKTINMSLEDGIFTATFEKHHKVSFNINTLLQTLKDENIDEINKNNYEKTILVQQAKKFTPKVKLQINNITTRDSNILSLDGYLLFSYK